MSKVSIQGVPLELVFAEVVNGARPVGMGLVHQNARKTMLDHEAAAYLRDFRANVGPKGRLYPDFVWGRPIKVDFSEATEDGCVEARLYDRDHGEGAFARAVDRARARQ